MQILELLTRVHIMCRTVLTQKNMEHFLISDIFHLNLQTVIIAVFNRGEESY